MSATLTKFKYMPTIRCSTYNLGAIKELSISTKDYILPLVILRGDSFTDIESFLTNWGNRPILLDSSRYTSDVSTDICIKLNNNANHFDNKLSKFTALKAISPNLIPVVGYNSSDNARDLVQLSLNLLSNFAFIAVRVNIADDISLNIALFQAILAALPDEHIQRIALLLDYGKIQSITEVKSTNLAAITTAISPYTFALIATLSTSYPSIRPSSGTTLNHPMLDPIWQNRFKSQITSFAPNIIYGDFSATDPTIESLDFDFPVHPIPYATYLLDYLEWFTAREGAGGEYEKFRRIAKKIRSIAGYHGDTFCWANQTIESIAIGTRIKAGNQAFWNKIKINQHISAIIQAFNNGSLQKLGTASHENDEEEEDV